ncbi:uncharacterized protein EAE97_006980 [Botrytis byssoidea]|uniref:Uncharacterized protein n=1 Tax=Botrytis byssoidea TaxID=139641 RepID=A0A9P5LYB5_9HELO|nr:uncharacterized protein EAE97_006980 [Botrytis byssoidea]KAF7940794.1 hypothetical protein EAE97_006980 [Botrytis byssoidea]
MSTRSEYNIVESFRLLDTISSGLPKAIVALCYSRTPENGKSYLDRALFVKELLEADPKTSSAGGRQLGARFLSIAEDLEEEISYRFYVPGGQNSGPLYGEYVQGDELGSVGIEKFDQGRGLCKSTAVVWRKWEPLKDLERDERNSCKRDNIALKHIVQERRLYVKNLLKSHESSVGMNHRGRG